MEFSIHDELYARAIGWQVLEYLRREHPGEAAKEIEGDALRVLEKIRTILNDQIGRASCRERVCDLV